MQKTLPQPRVRTGAVTQVVRERWEWIALGVVVLWGFGLRMWAIRWGLPYVDHPDEPALVNVVLDMMRNHDLNPHFFLYPSLYFYVLYAVFSIHHRWGMATGLYPRLDQMTITTDLYTTIPEFFVWGRLLAIVIGSLTVLAVYHVGKRTWSGGAGVIAALVVAISPFHMRHSQYITTDVASAWLTVLAYGGATAIWQHGRWRAYLLAGLCAGLAASTKYNAAVVVLPIVAAHVLHDRQTTLARSGRLIAAGAMAVLGFVIGTPYAVLAWPEFRGGVLRQMNHYGAGAHGDFVGAWNVGGYLQFFWLDGLRPTLAIALLIGLLVLAMQRRSALVLWISFAVPYVLVFVSQPSHFVRNLMPLVVLCAVPVGVAGAWMIAFLRERQPRFAPLLIAMALLIMFALPTQAAIGLTRFVARTDSKVLAAQFVRALPRGQRIAVELNPVEWSGDPLIQAVPFLTEHTLDWYRANNYRYLVANERVRDQHDQQLYANLRAGAAVVRVFPGDSSGQPGPQIEVLDLGQHPDQLALVPRRARFGDELQLLGYELHAGDLRSAITPLQGADQRTIVSGQSVQINLAWQAAAVPRHDYMLFVHLLDASGAKVAQRDALLRQDEYPSSRWIAGEIVVDRADLPLPALPAGTYTIVLGVYQLETGARLALVGDQPDLRVDDATLRLATIEVIE